MDETRDIFTGMPQGISVCRTPQNLGFLRNCNHAARSARGEFLVFLNNDTVVLPNWLDSIIETLERDTSCGMVGSKLLNLDGTLQEAGAIYWRDGSAWNFGRNQNPRSHEFGYRKEVDYCSGASIGLRREIWDRLGGFDELYAPAYCEEVDLAFRLRENLGLQTIYQPCSMLVHHEGVSHGTDIQSGIKSYQKSNQEKFYLRWRHVLAKDHFDKAKNIFLARDRSRHKPHMLFVDHYVPAPDCDAGSRQMDAYLKLFAKIGYHITLWPDNLHYDPSNSPRYEQLGIEVVNGITGQIRFEDWIQENGSFLHVAFLSRPHIASNYLPRIACVCSTATTCMPNACVERCYFTQRLIWPKNWKKTNLGNLNAGVNPMWFATLRERNASMYLFCVPIARRGFSPCPVLTIRRRPGMSVAPLSSIVKVFSLSEDFPIGRMLMRFSGL
jgi:GT2 family glycosyltransferase